MAYDSRVFRILIASPSDVHEEREIAVRLIQEWNDLNSYTRKVVLLPLRWETHTAPEYGTRPQEVINRIIVDECDLLVGVFWTRIGSPTGVADSGTLEEIERVTKAGKPAMLYFSQVPIDPERIDVTQIAQLRAFKEKILPSSLVETYRGVIKFRDKFSRQLEIKIRDLQRNEAVGSVPLRFEFLSTDTGDFAGVNIRESVERATVSGIDEVPEHYKEVVSSMTEQMLKLRSYRRIAFGIKNESASGVRNLYIELYLRSKSPLLEVSDRLLRSLSISRWASGASVPSAVSSLLGFSSESFTLSDEIPDVLSKYESGLQKQDAVESSEQQWRLSVEWDALQPQRIRLIKPILYVRAPEEATLVVSARVFTDSFPEPLVLETTIHFEPRSVSVLLSDLLPDREKQAEEQVERQVSVAFSPAGPIHLGNPG